MSQFWTVMITSGTVGTVLTALFGWLQHRARQRFDTQAKAIAVEENMRKELWDEIHNLRTALKEASATLMELQGRFLSLLTMQQTTVDNMRRLGALLNNALASLDRVEELERLILNDNDLIRAQVEISAMKQEAALIRAKAASIVEVT